MRKLFGALAVLSTSLCLSACAVGGNDQEWYSPTSHVFTSNVGAYKVKFPSEPKRVPFDEFKNQEGGQGITAEYAKKHNIAGIDAYEWTGDGLKLTSTYCLDNNKDKTQNPETLDRIARICLSKFLLKETGREDATGLSGSSGLFLQGTTKENDSFQMLINLDKDYGVAQVFLIQGKWDALNGPIGSKFFQNSVVHSRNVGYMGT